ncbi:BofC C-terminal domain-containing protein [Bacillus massiliigorillae]|uniref:BofC C-terminal domain-containing protein n=1 Tax=Bacillus massiliigorillae TaxID=1243664 RepID=UPI0003A6F166|nr:BofC C-terminal domain-containing protein [Bacillus massiliigorillae]
MYKRRISKKIYFTFLLSIIIVFFLSAWDSHDQPTLYTNDIKKVILQTIYFDGEKSEEVLFREGLSVEEIVSEFKAWQLVVQTDKELVLQKYTNDISPLLKANGYFGITEDGTLSIFNGKPTQSDVIQSFFHIDVEMLEAKTHHDLVEGIRVKDKKQYESVLETFEPYME